MLDPSLSPREFRRDEMTHRVTIADIMVSAEAANVDGRRWLCFRHPCRRGDMLSFNQFTLQARNGGDCPVLVELKLYHASGRTEEIRQPKSLTGGREILGAGEEREIHFPAEAFGVYGRPDGWRDITVIEAIFKTERGTVTETPLLVSAGPLSGEYLLLAEGPRLTAAGLQTLLKGYLPEPSPPHPVTPDDLLLLRIPAPHPHPQGDADAVLHGRIMGYDLSFPLPWHTPPSPHLEWAHFFHRHHFLREILLAFADCPDCRYVTFIRDVLLSWIKENPVCVGSNGGAGPAWETLSTAWRLRIWLTLKKTIWLHKAFDREVKQRILCSLWEHARHLFDHQGHPNNWRLIEGAALALAGLCLPEFMEADRWREEGMTRLADACRQQFLPDGVHFERSPLYHALCLQALLEVNQAAVQVKFPVPETITDVLGMAAAYLGALCRPDFTWPSINDSGSADSDYTALMSAAGRFLSRPELTWYGSRGADGRPPVRDFHVFPQGGMGIMRSGPSRKGHYLVFRVAPPGTFHRHGDVLALDVTTNGVPRLVDPGITAYAPTAQTSRYRSAGAHNTVLIDGKGPECPPVPEWDRTAVPGNDFIHYEEGPLQVMGGICREYGTETGTPRSFSRTVIFVDRSYWVVHDRVLGSGGAALTACWQFHPGVRAVLRGNAIVVHDDGDRGFALVPFRGGREFDIALEQQMVSLGGRDIPALQARYAFAAVLPCHFSWLLYPFESRYRFRDITGTKEEGGGAIRIEVRRCRGVRDILMLEGFPVTVGDWERTGPGRVVLSRQDDRSGGKTVP